MGEMVGCKRLCIILLMMIMIIYLHAFHVKKKDCVCGGMLVENTRSKLFFIVIKEGGRYLIEHTRRRCLHSMNYDHLLSSRRHICCSNVQNHFFITPNVHEGILRYDMNKVVEE